jgi:protein-ribulosamine 3-kinase
MTSMTHHGLTESQVIRGPSHKEMALGEFKSQKEIAKYVPKIVAIPLAQGTLKNDQESSFFLTTFRTLSDRTPDPSQLVEVLERLHRTSMSPNGKFGFHVVTFNGVIPNVNAGCDTWEKYFTRQLRSDVE